MLDAMLPFQVNYYGNPHSRTHAYGWESESAMETARKVSKIQLIIYILFLSYDLLFFYHNVLCSNVFTISCVFFINSEFLYLLVNFVQHFIKSEFERP